MSSSSSDTESTTSILLLSKLKSLSLQGPQRLVLASQSPRRREILDMMGLNGRYTVQPSPLDEEKLQQELAKGDEVVPEVYARILAESKANALSPLLQDDAGSSSSSSSSTTTYVIGSDTIVDLEGTILEKPKSKSDAISMLTRLSGSWHKVHTGVAIYTHSSSEMKLTTSFTDTARVKFASLTSDDVEAYVETGEPMDKAGSYGIQGVGGQLVERMEGDFFTVMGLPMHRLSRELAKVLEE